MSKAIDHGARAHAILSPSGSHRWLNCTPSARLEEAEPESNGTVFTQEGTFAHELGEIMLRAYSDPDYDELEARKKLEADIESFNAANKTKFSIEAMEPHVEEYVTAVIEDFEECLRVDPAALLLIEEPFDLTSIIPEGGGTNDAIIISDGTAHVHDLKFGQGVIVSAVENSQLMLYAYGALESFNGMYDIRKVVLHIDQPRVSNFSAWEISVEELYKWAENFVKPKAKLAFAGEGKFCAGSWCQFCKVKARCRHLAEHSLALAKYDFQEPALLTDDEVADVMQRLPGIADWAASVRQYAYERALTGKKWPGYKLVESKTMRRWKNESQVVEILDMEGYTESQIYNKKLKGLGDIEKLVGKKSFPSLLGEYVEKPEGQATLVPETDKRPEIELGDALQKALEDFAD